MKKIFMITILLSAFLLNAQIVHHGFVRLYLGALSQQDGDYSVLQNTFDWRLDYGKGDVGLFVNPVFDHNALNNEIDISLRQAYLDIYFDNFDLRVGKQQIIWGKADGVFITDVISPRNLMEFILPNFEEIRIGVNAVKLDYYLGNSTFEAVWLPIFQSTIQPAENSIWAPQMPDFPMPVSYDYSIAEVENKLSNSELAFKYSYLGSAIDFELMAAWMWDDNPAMHIYTQPDSTLLIKPEQHRLPLAGASFSKSLGGAVVRGEGAWYFDKKFAAENLNVNGIKEKNYVHYLVGYDHNWFGLNVSWQFIQEYILDYEDDIRNDEFSSTMTFLVTEDFLRETLRLEFFTYYGINNEDALLRPKVVYDLADGFEAQLGANIFVGEEGNFGQYDENDMVFLKVRYDF
ncbi:MAG: hypothetical protein K9N09_01070 [Candidatus Cloacimonetes bacterium]|nr:hypothetical protein [Candidatus Cloacimonadota bacterium]MCF7813003.1 hypothetical protein [Candidatus Cloacimonadota bacterium]MCF7867265.1 hypothetical protein [Candidatus Cloacimonadota bacterium]MCF7882709.1 hypothetical protein [Candidatus Cloacimonadota bacterium]